MIVLELVRRAHILDLFFNIGPTEFSETVVFVFGIKDRNNLGFSAWTVQNQSQSEKFKFLSELEEVKKEKLQQTPQEYKAS